HAHALRPPATFLSDPRQQGGVHGAIYHRRAIHGGPDGGCVRDAVLPVPRMERAWRDRMVLARRYGGLPGGRRVVSRHDDGSSGVAMDWAGRVCRGGRGLRLLVEGPAFCSVAASIVVAFATAPRWWRLRSHCPDASRARVSISIIFRASCPGRRAFFVPPKLRYPRRPEISAPAIPRPA